MDLKAILEELYPEGVIGPGSGALKGQCGVFVQTLIQMPMPNNLWGHSAAEKEQKVRKYGILAKDLNGDFRQGDVIVTRENKENDHVAIVNDLIGDQLRLSESNYSKPLRVSHTRLISKNHPKIYGVIRGTYKFAVPVEAPTEEKKMEFPVKLKILAIINNSPWVEDGKHLKRITDWVMEMSEGKVLLEIDRVDTSFMGIPFVEYNPTWWNVDNQWQEENLVPLAMGYDMYFFFVEDLQWPWAVTSVAGMNTGNTSGPVKTVLTGRNGEIDWWSVGVDGEAIVARAIHELIGHGVPHITKQADTSHHYAFDLKDFPRTFKEINYELLVKNKWTSKQRENDFMVGYYIEGDKQTLYALVGGAFLVPVAHAQNKEELAITRTVTLSKTQAAAYVVASKSIIDIRK